MVQRGQSRKSLLMLKQQKTVVSSTQKPRISIFYGDNLKGEATYAQWVYEVKCLLIEKTHTRGNLHKRSGAH